MDQSVHHGLSRRPRHTWLYRLQCDSFRHSYGDSPPAAGGGPAHGERNWPCRTRAFVMRDQRTLTAYRTCSDHHPSAIAPPEYHQLVMSRRGAMRHGRASSSRLRTHDHEYILRNATTTRLAYTYICTCMTQAVRGPQASQAEWPRSEWRARRAGPRRIRTATRRVRDPWAPSTPAVLPTRCDGLGSRKSRQHQNSAPGVRD